MAGRHIAIHTWLEALGLQMYLPVFGNYAGVEDLIYATEAEIRELGLKNSAHRAKIISSLRILREKYEKGKPTGSGVFSLHQQPHPQSPSIPPSYNDFPSVIFSPEKLQQDLQRELNADPSELKSRAWYHGRITRQHAEAIVQNNGDFLVRDSISKPGDFVLTCAWRGVPLHFMVNALVGDCAPGSLPSISYQFEDESFPSIQDLIHSYVTQCKPVTFASGAVLLNPVARSMPLSYYDSKYGSLSSLDGGGHYTPSQSPKASPFITPTSSPRTSPKMSHRGPKRTGSQPLLSVDDTYVDRSRSPSLDRCGSLPVINVIPPGGTDSSETHAPTPPASPGVVHQRSGSAPVVMNGGVFQGGGGGSSGNFPGNTLHRMQPAGSESTLNRAPPPKPSRIPSIKYKQRPFVLVRNKELYADDGRDYSDYKQVSETPSWLDSNKIHLGFEAGGSPVTKCYSFQGNRENQTVDSNYNNLNKSYHTLPSKPRQTKQTRTQLHSDSNSMAAGKDMVNTYTPNIIGTEMMDSVSDLEQIKGRVITMPGHNLGSRINLVAFSSSLLPEENKLLEPSTLVKVKSLLLSSNARALAAQLTKVDLEVLRVAQEDDFGMGVNSGLELLTLPQGEQLREDIIERSQCLRLFVMTSLMTCNAATERAKLLSQWILIAGELRTKMGNLFAFASIMEALTSPQVQRLSDTWLVLRQNHTSSAYLFDTKLRPLYKSLNEASGILPLQNVTIPHVTPVVHLMQRDLESLADLLAWEAADKSRVREKEIQPTYGLDFLLSHLDIIRIVASQCSMYRASAVTALSEVNVEQELEDTFRTELHLRLMWGVKGAGAPRGERVKKFDRLLTALSEKLEPPGDDGTEV